MSSDGVRVYWIEEMGFWIPISSGKERAVIPVRTSNVLSAHDLETGKLAWERGGELGIKAERNLAGRFFLGSPLPMAGRLYCLVDVNQEIQLNVLNAATGELEWSQPLATPNQLTIAQDLGRRTSGVSVAYADGVLVCPTDAGAVVALDLTTRSLMWGFPTETGNANVMDPRAAARIRVANPPASAAHLPSGWIDSTPTIHQDKVILTPLRSSKIYLLDLLTGKRIWEQPRGQGLYVAGVTQDMVIVVGTRNVQTWSLNNDQTGWKNPIQLSAAPTGRGVITGAKLLLPAGKKLLVIDLKTGKELKPLPAPDKIELGNLVVAQGRLISQSVDSLDIIPFPKLDDN
jgi:outer membrane protein assembly factor BamB